MSDIEMNEDEVAGEFPRSRLDQMGQSAREFAAIGWAAKSGDTSKLDRVRQDAKFDWATRSDAGVETVYVARQLEYIRKGLYEIKYTALKSPKLISYNTSVPRGAQQFTVKSIDIAGEPAIERDDNDEIPTVELKVASGTMGFFNMNLAYSFTDQDAAEAMFSGMPLPTMKATAVRTQMARKADIIAFYGETTSGVKGLLNRANTTTYTVPSTGASGSQKWKDKDSDAILLDLNGAGDAIITATNEVEEPDTWLIPLDAHRVIATRRVGDGTSETVLKYFLQNRDTPVTVVATTKSEAANASNWSGSASRLLVYKNDAAHLEFHLPVPFYQAPPQYRNFRTTTNCMMRCGGVADYIPKASCYADGVS